MKFREARKLGPIVFRDPVLLCGGLYLLLYFDAGGFRRLGLLAAFLPSQTIYYAAIRRSHKAMKPDIATCLS